MMGNKEINYNIIRNHFFDNYHTSILPTSYSIIPIKVFFCYFEEILYFCRTATIS